MSNQLWPINLTGQANPVQSGMASQLVLPEVHAADVCLAHNNQSCHPGFGPVTYQFHTVLLPVRIGFQYFAVSARFLVEDWECV